MSIALAVLASAASAKFSNSLPTRTIEIKMPNSHPEQPETYLCTPMRLDKTNTNYIVGFQPNATSKTAHHMLLYGYIRIGNWPKLLLSFHLDRITQL